MSAKDYQICPALFKSYIARVSKRNPNLMTDDRHEITDAEIVNLIEWRFRRFCEENKKNNDVHKQQRRNNHRTQCQGFVVEELKR